MKPAPEMEFRLLLALPISAGRRGLKTHLFFCLMVNCFWAASCVAKCGMPLYETKHFKI